MGGGRGSLFGGDSHEDRAFRASRGSPASPAYHSPVNASAAIEDGVAAENEAADVAVAGVSQFLFCRGGRNPGAGVLVREINSEIIISNHFKLLESIAKYNESQIQSNQCTITTLGTPKKWPVVVVKR